MVWQGINKRKFPRIRCHCIIRVSTNDLADRVIDTYTENIGVGGICVVLDREVGIFEDVSLSLFLEETGEPILCNGTVMWVVKKHPTDPSEKVKYDTGIEFYDLKKEETERIVKLIERGLRQRFRKM
ncbi:MAG: PilZ domain-containing protein [Candidatus Omnitrophota bacterium]